jgi:hypothetical protein
MLNNIFTMISNGSAVAFNHTTGEKLTPKQVEKMEMNIPKPLLRGLTRISITKF